MSLGVIILAGGASSRMGEDKARLDWNGLSAVARLAAVAGELGASAIVTAGGGDFGLPRVDDPEAGGGPVVGIAAGLAALRDRGCARGLVLAVDAPTIRPGDIQALLAAPAPGAAFEGLNLPLLIDLRALPATVGAGWSVRRLIEEADLVRPAAPAAAVVRLRGANTPEERAQLLAALLAHETAQKSGEA